MVLATQHFQMLLKSQWWYLGESVSVLRVMHRWRSMRRSDLLPLLPVCVHVCMCVRERERKSEREKDKEREIERERIRERKRER